MRTCITFALLIFLLPVASQGSFIEDYKRARDSMEDAFSLVSSFQNTLKGNEQSESLNLPKIISVYGWAIRQDPDSPFLNFALGESHRLAGDSLEADRHYGWALENAKELGELFFLIELFEKKGLSRWTDEAKENLSERKLNMGISSLPLLSSHYRQTGVEFLRRGDRGKARSAFEFAQRLDPCQLETHMLLLRLSILERNLKGAMEAVSSVTHCLKDFRNQGRVYSSLLLLLVLAIPLALASGVWGSFFRHVPSVEHRVFEFLPSRLPSKARAIAAWSIIALPFLWGLPIFLLTVSVTALVWVLFSRRERFLALLLLAILMGSPLFLRAFRLLRIPEDPESKYHLLTEVQKSGWETDWEERLVGTLEEEREQFELNFALGLLRKRRGDFAGAIRAYEAAINLSPRRAVAYNNLGNIYFATQDHERAIEMYDRAIKLDPRLAAPHYNLAQVYQRTLMFRESTEEHRKASRLDFDLVRTSIETSSEHFNRAVVDATIPAAFFWQEIFDGFLDWEALRRSPLTGMSLVAAIFFVALLIMSRYFKQGELGLRCSLCGRPVCVKCREKFEEQPVCPVCDWRVSAAKSENIQVRLMKGIPRRSGILARLEGGILSILYPGTGHLFLGAVGRGLFFAFLAAVLITHLFLMDFVQGRPLPASLKGLSPDRTLLLVLLGLIWIWSLISVSRTKERPWPSKEA